MTDSLYAVLAPWAVYPEKMVKKESLQKQTTQKHTKQKHTTQKYSTQNQTLDINTIDSFQLSKEIPLKMKLGARIIRYRNRLGGFVHLDQLKEVFGITNDQVNRLVSKLYISKEFKPEKVNISKVDFKTLIYHPYIDYNLAKLMLNYKKHCGENCSWDEFKNLKILDTTVNERLIYYFD